MENIRNYKTNSKTKFVYFCDSKNQNEDNTDDKEAYKQGDKVDTQQVLLATFVDRRRYQMYDNCKQPKKITCCPADLFIGWQQQNQNQNKKCKNKNTKP